MSVLDAFEKLWSSVQGHATQPPSRVTIPANQVAGAGAAVSLQPGEHYFQVQINEMFLRQDRKWFAEYDPLVLAVTEFSYAGKAEALPFVVGPSMFEKFKVDVPQGMVFSDTRVAGIHPYRGGPVAIAILLYRVKRADAARKFLGMVERAARVVDFSTALGSYIRVSEVLLEGVDAVLGLKDTVPVVGHRRPFDPTTRNDLGSGYFVLIDLPEEEVRAEDLWVEGNRLHTKDAKGKAAPFRAADFVLYSFVRSPDRGGDETTLPFHGQWEQAKKEAAIPKDDAWTNAKTLLASLYQTMVVSPDLLQRHADELIVAYKAQLKAIHDRAVSLAAMAGDERAGMGERVRARALALLED